MDKTKTDLNSGAAHFRRLEDIVVWKRACRLAVDVLKTVETDGMGREWGLKDQIKRSVVSIPSNIAEGFEREGNTEFKRFRLIAKGSCGELRTQLYIAKAAGYLSPELVDPLIQESIEISSMLRGLISHILNQR